MIKNTNSNFTVTFRTKKSVKEKASKLFDQMGLDMSSALNLFLNNVILRKEIPFRIVTENGYTPEFEKEILDSIKDRKNWGTYKNVDEMIKSLNS